MELGELVGMLIPDQSADEECPFSHEKPKPEGKNELGGIGTTLAKNMGDGIGIHTEPPPTGRSYKEGTIDEDPRKRTSNPVRSVTIEVNGEEIQLQDGTPLEYPLTCGAHHLIPAQEALKGHPILRYMCKGYDGEKQDFRKNGDPDPAVVTQSKVWGNVLYNINGSQNGVWLPGNYAVGGGKAGIEYWKSPSGKTRKAPDDKVLTNWASALDLNDEDWKSRKDTMEEDGPSADAISDAFRTRTDPKYMLIGKNYEIKSSNPKWSYVKAAIDEIHGYFHDRHKPYSNEVYKYLTKVFEKYEQMYERSTNLENPCKKCEEAKRPDGADAKLVGPPYAIVNRLHHCSQWFKGHLIGKHSDRQSGKRLSATNIYTSKWVKAWMDNVELLRKQQEGNAD